MNAAVFRPCVVGLLCLGLVLPGVGRAAQVEPTVSPPEAQEQPSTEQPPPPEVQEVPVTPDDAPHRFQVEDEQEQWEQRTGAPRGLRILGEVGGGLLTAGALGLVGGLATGLLCSVLRTPSNAPFDGLVCIGFGFLGAGVGAALGVPLGVWGAGELLGGNGSLLAALGGGALGLVGGLIVLGVAGSAAQSANSGSVVFGLAPPALALTGCIIGYELSQKAPRRWATRGGLQPVLSFTPGATVVGLGGSF